MRVAPVLPQPSGRTRVPHHLANPPLCGAICGLLLTNDGTRLDPLSGNAVLNGVPVEVTTAG